MSTRLRRHLLSVLQDCERLRAETHLLVCYTCSMYGWIWNYYSYQTLPLPVSLLKRPIFSHVVHVPGMDGATSHVDLCLRVYFERRRIFSHVVHALRMDGAASHVDPCL